MARTRNTAWLTALCLLGLLLLALSPLPLAGRLEERGSELMQPASSALHDLVQPLSDVLLHAGQVQQLSEENAELRQAVARLEAEAAALREAGAAAEQSAALRAAVGDGGAGHLAAAVLVRDPAPGRRSLLIDKGAVDGVVAGQPVLGPGATLVGTVVEVQQRRARVRLLDDEASAVAAVVQQSRTAGALAGTNAGLRLDYVPVGAQLTVGDLVLTSPLGGRLPAGLLIGRVSSVRAEPHDLFASVEVEPLTDYRRLEHVLIATAFVPSDEGPVQSQAGGR